MSICRVEGAHELVGEADEGHAEHDAEDEARETWRCPSASVRGLVGQLDDADLRRLRLRRMAAHRANALTGNRAVKRKAGGGESTSER